jgi:hypothetical protein
MNILLNGLKLNFLEDRSTQFGISGDPIAGPVVASRPDFTPTSNHYQYTNFKKKGSCWFSTLDKGINYWNSWESFTLMQL